MRPPPAPIDALERGWLASLARPGVETALIAAGGDVGFVHTAPRPRGPRTAALDLVDAIWHEDPDRAHARLRGRIFTTAAADPLDRAVAQVCARKLTSDAHSAAPRALPPEARDLTEAARASRAHHLRTSRLGDAPASVQELSEAELGAWLLERPVVHDAPLRHRDRPVAAVLTDASGRVVGAARNTNGSNRLRHAEVNLLQAWFEAGGGPLEPGWTVWVGLQCCRLCAALIARSALDPAAIQVRFAAPEPGRFGASTALQALGVERGIWGISAPRPAPDDPSYP